MDKKNMSAGCIVAAVIGGFFLFAAVILIVVFAFGWMTFRRQGVPTVNPSPVSSSPATGGSSTGPAATPDPTPEQVRALEGGKPISWAAQGLSWTVPATWSL